MKQTSATPDNAPPSDASPQDAPSGPSNANPIKTNETTQQTFAIAVLEAAVKELESWSLHKAIISGCLLGKAVARMKHLHGMTKEQILEHVSKAADA